METKTEKNIVVSKLGMIARTSNKLLRVAPLSQKLTAVPLIPSLIRGTARLDVPKSQKGMGK